MDWGFFWLMFVLKLPVVALLLTVWWAVRAVPVLEVEATGPEEGEDEGGGSDRLSHRRRPKPSRPRGPHGGRMPPAPPRTRPVVAASAQRRRLGAR